MEVAKVSAKGQINIPIAVRKLLNLTEGDKVIFIKDGDGVRMLNASSLNLDKKEGGAHAEKA
jgi:AbrB family looped-hinge helix DNA binding protein